MANPTDSTRGLSLGELLSRLHSAVRQFVSDLDAIIDRNKNVGVDDIRGLRASVTERLRAGNDEVENKKLLEVLDLLSMDKTVIALMKDDAEEWLDFIDAIESHIASGEYKATEAEKEELARMRELTARISGLIRK
ncbi:hypothetical protein M1329_00020 [Candidatus Marsarchaeota archaeon]|nr:hypothetical protein [Candidatus Marsarchaeota archaeon]MCL5099936.1 hypothetical protein [Candidatus Marsarchaeota archaeon]